MCLHKFNPIRKMGIQPLMRFIMYGYRNKNMTQSYRTQRETSKMLEEKCIG